MTYTRSYHHDLPVDHVCNDADITDLVLEIENLRNDTDLPRYEDPTVAEMQLIFDRAATYDGPWYHSDVLFNMDPPVSPTYAYLRQQMLDLPASSGVHASVSYEMPELTAKLRRDFGPDRD